jgi:hypothetical protein
MALTHTIKSFDPDDSGNVIVGFKVENDKGSIFVIDKPVVKGSKSDAAIIEEAYEAAKDQINAWNTSDANIGKTWDPSSKSLS